MGVSDDVETESPEPAGVRCAVPVGGPAGKFGAFRGLAGPSAFEGRATNVPSAIEKPRRVVRPSLKGRIPLDVFSVAPDTRCVSRALAVDHFSWNMSRLSVTKDLYYLLS